MEQGWVYVLVNSSIPGMYKVGRTTRLPSERAAELSAATGVATPFVIAFEQEFADCVTAEQQIHAELDRRGHRIASNREFFSGSSTDIVRVVLDAATAIPAPAGQPFAGQPLVGRPLVGQPLVGQPLVGQQRNAATSATDLFAEGDRHLHGTIDTLQDGAEAVRFYHRAATRGSIMAMERLGCILARGAAIAAAAPTAT
jgi:T5orf172 domain